MYIPASFQETDQEKLFDFVQQNSFGMLVSDCEGEPFVSHLPFLLENGSSPNGWLVGHMARANPQWRAADGKRVLAIFSGPHAYISPSWYEAENVVPTWNYVAVHVYGTFHAIQEPDALIQIVRKTTEFYEGAMAQPWGFDGDSTFVRKMVHGIVGFRIEITRWEGKWKLSQNHPEERQEKVARALALSPDEAARQVGALMRKRSDNS